MAKAPAKDERTPSAKVRFWLNEINDSKKRDKEFRKEGARIVDIYAGRKKDQIPFNILYSNTETLMPALYSSTPKPVVQRRFRDADPLGKAASLAGQRVLEFLIDTNIEEYEPFDLSMSGATLDGLLPGRGCTRIKYEADVTAVPEDAYGPTPPKDADAETADAAPPTVPTKTWEMVCTETTPWDRVYFGYAKRWSKMPWVGFEHYLDREEAGKLLGAGVAAKLIYTKGNDKTRDNEWDGPRKKDDGAITGERKTTLVYEIWDRKKKRVLFISPTWQGDYLKEEEDPLELSGFFPMPKPIQFVIKTNDLTPTPLYILYENQAKELNRISVRINRIVDALKVRGAYDGSLGDTLDNVLKGDDNSLIPTENASNIALEGGLAKYIWFMPLDMLVATLKELIVAREQCKQVIYEVTGIADILRGTTDANETLGAQQIKNQWASMRIKMMQNEVRRYVRESLRIMLEIAAKKFSPETFARMTGLPYVSAQEKQQAQMLLQAGQAQGMQPDPKALQIVQTPSWEEVIRLLDDDLERAYRIDIETNSTVEVNEQEDKQNIAEAMQAMGSFMEGVSPLVQQGVMPFEAAKSMLLSIVRRFRFGTEVEEEIKSMQPPQQQPNAEQVQAEKEKLDAAAKEKQLADALAQEKAFREFDRREAELKARESQVSHDEEMLKLRQEFDRFCKDMETQRADEQAKGREEQIKGAEKQATERVKQAETLAKKSEAPTAAAKQMQQALKDFLQTQQQQNEQVTAMVAKVIKAASMPRRKTLVRGDDDRTSHIDDVPVGDVDVEGLPPDIAQALLAMTGPKRMTPQRGADGRPVGMEQVAVN